MTTNVDALIDKVILDVYYNVWKDHPTFNKLESFWKQYNDLHIAEEVEDRVLWGELELVKYTEEKISTINSEERKEMTNFIVREIKNMPAKIARDSCMSRLQSAIIKKDWQYIFRTYSYKYAVYHFSSCSSLPYLLFDMVLADFKFKTAIAKVKRNKLYILGLSMKLSMRDCGIELTPISQKLLDEN